MILGMEIALFCLGLYALVTGKMTLGKNRVVHGAAARMLGVIALLPVPLAVFVGLVICVVMGPGALSPANPSNRWLAFAVEGGAIVFCVVVIYGVGGLAVGAANAGARSQENEQEAFRRCFPERFGGEPLTGGAALGTTQVPAMSLLNCPAPRPAEETARQLQKDRSALRPWHYLLMIVVVGGVVFKSTNQQFANVVPAGDGVCHLHLTVPEDAEVFVDGARTREKGAHREFVSPPLQSGTHSIYKVSVRYTDQQGRRVDDTRDVPVVANELVRLDFTPSGRPK
jgi:uncharacterized protein (TIGR03000 family)